VHDEQDNELRCKDKDAKAKIVPADPDIDHDNQNEESMNPNIKPVNPKAFNDILKMVISSQFNYV
jgi:hypothetical protein